MADMTVDSDIPNTPSVGLPVDTPTVPPAVTNTVALDKLQEFADANDAAFNSATIKVDTANQIANWLQKLADLLTYTSFENKDPFAYPPAANAKMTAEILYQILNDPGSADFEPSKVVTNGSLARIILEQASGANPSTFSKAITDLYNSGDAATKQKIDTILEKSNEKIPFKNFAMSNYGFKLELVRAFPDLATSVLNDYNANKLPLAATVKNGLSNPPTIMQIISAASNADNEGYEIFYGPLSAAYYTSLMPTSEAQYEQAVELLDIRDKLAELLTQLKEQNPEMVDDPNSSANWVQGIVEDIDAVFGGVNRNDTAAMEAAMTKWLIGDQGQVGKPPDTTRQNELSRKVLRASGSVSALLNTLQDEAQAALSEYQRIIKTIKAIIQNMQESQKLVVDVMFKTTKN